ncbi:MAG: SDR family NAD(P)-dependent oxidoreductase [Scytonematopsis contorta HA4267-MV1]|jgi:non-ribosomal peptide synthase protein (TIGR01720 family)|nr:SDR family NAD(P)-dependent oxidoreductase [Scytonematopsis contorta HA4267-MV1]
MSKEEVSALIEEVAIIGMAGRFPGAKNIAEFWQNLHSGVESISIFTDEELASTGINQSLLNDKNYVKSGYILEDTELFDANFFDFNPKEAETTDPQQRIFLECAWEALENAGYDSMRCESRIGIYAGTSENNYLSFDFQSDSVGSSKCYQTSIGNDKDYLTTRVSYKLNLTGPSLTVQTACSTSLVAVSLACQSLLNYQCDIALAGGVSIHVPQKTGYLHEPGGTLSSDGHCYAFDAKAQGITIGNGVGTVVLKRLSDAITDGDCIHAVIKSTAINNDGSSKVGFTAPSVDGQVEVITEAMMLASVEPETITYIEAHGTGTALGDPIEIAALTKVFRATTDKKGFCAIGSVKTSIGHLDAASGVAGLIKTVLALKNKQIPPSLNFSQPNPKIDFANSPFYVNTKLTEWKIGIMPRRAGVSSLGMGGTNAHVILEEAPILEVSSSSRPWQLLLLSAKTESALETATQNLVQHLTEDCDINLADLAYTLQVGRRQFNYRRILVCQNNEDALSALSEQREKRVFTYFQKSTHPSITFMFPGQGAQYVNMGKELYQHEPTFRDQVDRCCLILNPYLGLDLRSLLYPKESESKETAERLRQTNITQPALFVVEYALAQLWISWGIPPSAMIGHSIGEYVAACLANVMSLEDALALVVMRGLLMQQMPSGAMLSVSLPETEVINLLNENLSLENLSLAAINAPSSCVISGTHAAIETFKEQLIVKGIKYSYLHTSHAFHSQMTEPVKERFIQEIQKIKLNPPQIPFISNVTGTWITPQEATDPNYWGRHLRQTVHFSGGINKLLEEKNCILLEVGPARTLSTFAKQHIVDKAEQIVLSSLRHPQEEKSDVFFLLNTLGNLWLAGVNINWCSFYTHESRQRIPLPTYPFERQRYWIEPQKKTTDFAEANLKKPNIADWFYVPVWKQAILFPTVTSSEQSKKLCWLVFADKDRFGTQITQFLQNSGHHVISVEPGEQFQQLSKCIYTVNPQKPKDYDTLLAELEVLGKIPDKIVHLWSVAANEQTQLGSEYFEKCQNLGFYSLLFLVQSFDKQDIVKPINIFVVTNSIHDVTGAEKLNPEQATILGMCKVIPQEYNNITCRSIDIVTPDAESFPENQLIDQLVTEVCNKSSDLVVAYRGYHRWAQTFEAIPWDNSTYDLGCGIKDYGVYLITGGLGGVGLELAEYLAKTVKAKLVLIGRLPLPQRDEWQQWLTTHSETDKVSRKIIKVQELEQLGAEVFIQSADVTNEAQMQAVIAQVCKRLGRINGVIHAAGIKLFKTIRQLDKDECEKQLKTNGHGLFVLEKVLQGIELDFCLLISSLSSVLGALGMAAYPSAHLFTDAFAYKHNQKNSTRWMSVNWDNWLTSELAAELTGKPEISTDGFMTPSEGVDVFKYVLSLKNSTQVVVSISDLQARIKKWIQRESSQIKADSLQVDSQSLHSRPNLRNTYVAPRDETEQILATIWQEVLGFEQVGIHDNFLELGGDSLLSIQVTAKANKAGLRLTNQHLFEYPTVAELASVASKTQAVLSQQGLVQGELPLTPIQHWFFEQDLVEKNHWNQTILLELKQVIVPTRLAQAVQYLLIQHDALRLRYVQHESDFQQINVLPDEFVPFVQVDLSQQPEVLQESAFEAATNQLQASLNLFSGPLLQVALFDLGTQQPQRLLLIIHHLAVDVGSWRILLDDLETAYQLLSEGKAIKLPAKTTSFKQWSERLIKYAQSTELQSEGVYWSSASCELALPLPVDYPGGANTVVSANTISVTLSAAETQALLKEVAIAYRVQVEEIVLSALMQATTKWTGTKSLLIDLEGNGRDVIFDDIDLSRTVGWFTTLAPAFLNLEEASKPEEALKLVKEKLHNLPNQGIGYGVLRYLGHDEIITEKIRLSPQAEIIFLYLGNLEENLPKSPLWKLSQKSSLNSFSLHSKRSHLLEVNALIIQNQLRVDWTYSTNVHKAETVQKLTEDFVQALRTLIKNCKSSSLENYTPSDFAEFTSSQWSQTDLENILEAINKSEGSAAQ